MPAVARIFDGEEAKLIALACSKPPKGRARWTLGLLENKKPYVPTRIFRGLMRKQKPRPLHEARPGLECTRWVWMGKTKLSVLW